MLPVASLGIRFVPMSKGLLKEMHPVAGVGNLAFKLTSFRQPKNSPRSLKAQEAEEVVLPAISKGMASGG